ncbi:MAG: hypothetical protein KDB21_11370 [Acidimicrobiales bacterium]|nr:hypothetical protein [Acidimicrobiales bacterium]
MTALVVALAVVVGLLAVLVIGLLRSHADILRALHELGVDLDPDAADSPAGVTSPVAFRTQEGVPEPRGEQTGAFDVVGATARGGSTKVGVVGTPHTTLLAFLSSGCLTCREFWDAFADPELRLPGSNTRLAIVTKGPANESLSAVRALAPTDVPTVMSDDAWTDYAVPVSPYFLLIDGPTSTVIGEGAAASWTQVQSLLSQALADRGIAASGEATPRARATGKEREHLADEALLAAGIRPGDPSLYPTAAPQDQIDLTADSAHAPATAARSADAAGGPEPNGSGD